LKYGWAIWSVDGKRSKFFFFSFFLFWFTSIMVLTSKNKDRVTKTQCKVPAHKKVL
jgi:hypothetical protein